MINIRGVRKSYREGGDRATPSRIVLDGLDLTLSPGETVVLRGRSGSGKSTLLNLIAGLDLPDEGRIQVAGADLARLDERARTLFRRRHVGFVFQAFNLIPTLTVLENLLLPLELGGVRPREGRTRALEWLGKVGLSDRAGAFPDILSGGEQQRVAVARALVHGPSLILADEPTGNLDLETGARVLGLLEEMRARAGSALLIVTHSPETVRFPHRRLALRAGRVEPE